MNHQRGFTLIELLFTVAIIGILAAVAVVAFSRDVSKAKSSEVAAIFTEMELQEIAYRGENGTFLSTGSSEADMYPENPGNLAGGVKIDDLPETWLALKINPTKESLLCSYVAITGKAGDGANIGAKAEEFGMNTIPEEDWFYLLARCDFDSDSAEDEYHFRQSDTGVTHVINRGK